MEKDLLKNQLLKIKADNWKIPEGIDAHDLTLEMMKNIGSVDSELRDELIFNLLFIIIRDKKISYEEMKSLLKMCLSEEYLFYGIGNINDDSVFKRTFTMLVIGGIVWANNQCEDEFLSETEFNYVYKEIIKYFTLEKDMRGYVDVKGWAHSVAHGADALCELSESKYIEHAKLVEILSVIKGAICINTYSYINEEDERLINAVESIINRNILSEEEINNWIESFAIVEKIGELPEDEHLRHNRKIFLRSLYFRFKKREDNKFLLKIENTIYKLPFYY